MAPRGSSRLMSAGSGRRPLIQSMCLSCRHDIRRRFASSSSSSSSSSAVAAEILTESSQGSLEASSPRQSYKLLAGVVLSRPPQITRDLHPFEKAFHLYQRRLNERLVLPFSRKFYYPKGTPSEVAWTRKIRQRITPARDIGRYNPRGQWAWNDEMLVGALESEPEHQKDALLRDMNADTTAVKKDTTEGGEDAAKSEPTEGKEMAEREADSMKLPMPRITEADLKGDEKSLDRLLQRTLYLLVLDGQNRWTFPTGTLEGREGLKQAAERILVQTAGPNMNTWIVGNAPIGHLELQYEAAQEDTTSEGVSRLGDKIFYMKARIMAGQAEMKNNLLGAKDFKWLAKEELRKLVSFSYWERVRNMLPER